MTTSQTTLGHNHSAFVMVEATDNIQALGTVHPRVLFELRLRTNSEKVQSEIHYLRLQVKFSGEALPGWPKGIFTDMVDKTKAEHLDRLVHAAKQYYDHGRHIAQGGSHAGDFPVNHREALFAINMAKGLLAEIGAATSGA